jgi:diguanylate cyclase
VFNDADAIERALQPILSQGEEISVRVTDAAGQMIYQRQSVDAENVTLPDWLDPAPVDMPIVTGGSTIGRVYIAGETGGIDSLLLGALTGALLAFAATYAVMLITRNQLDRRIIKPMQSLSAIAHRARDEGDFAARAKPTAIAEIHNFGQDFNALLHQLQQWQRQIDDTHSLLNQRANFDDLSGLPNRGYFGERVADAIRHAERTQETFALLFMDGDRFKEINDQHGHAAGDIVITEVARRLSALLRVGDVAARLGGDEFAVLVQHMNDIRDADAVVARIRDAMAVPITLGDNVTTTISLSVGVAVYPRDGQDAQTLTNHADQDMYRNKHSKA